MMVRLYLGVEGVFVYRTSRAAGERRGFVLVPYALDFLASVVNRFDCYWLTGLDRRGGNNQIKRAFRIALNQWHLLDELEFLFYQVNTTYWENDPVEGIHLDSDFYWIAANPDQASLDVLKMRGLEKRLMVPRKPNDLWKFSCLLEPVAYVPDPL